jgi:hypothetical protein
MSESPKEPPARNSYLTWRLFLFVIVPLSVAFAGWVGATSVGLSGHAEMDAIRDSTQTTDIADIKEHYQIISSRLDSIYEHQTQIRRDIGRLEGRVEQALLEGEN